MTKNKHISFILITDDFSFFAFFVFLLPPNRIGASAAFIISKQNDSKQHEWIAERENEILDMDKLLMQALELTMRNKCIIAVETKASQFVCEHCGIFWVI